tara:strand:- start:137 stop:412 length:276 start_codon:yes stop_codon:yes gene_type:complete
MDNINVSQTPEYKKAKQKEWYEKNKAKKNAYDKKYRQEKKNKERTKELETARKNNVFVCGCGETITGNTYSHKNSKLHKLYEKMLKINNSQ